MVIKMQWAKYDYSIPIFEVHIFINGSKDKTPYKEYKNVIEVRNIPHDNKRLIFNDGSSCKIDNNKYKIVIKR